MELENGSKILAASTSASAVRGMSFNIIFLDEFAFIPNILQSNSLVLFILLLLLLHPQKSSLFPPNGMNHFYKLWVDAQKGRNGYAWKKFTGLKC